jgi:transcriptional regulator with XRE-family HTH domain
MDPGFRRYCSKFGRRVREFRERAGLTQEDMMDKGFSLRHYQRIEAGRSVTLQTVWKLAKAFGGRAAGAPAINRLRDEQARASP